MFQAEIARTVNNSKSNIHLVMFILKRMIFSAMSAVSISKDDFFKIWAIFQKIFQRFRFSLYKEYFKNNLTWSVQIQKIYTDFF